MSIRYIFNSISLIFFLINVCLPLDLSSICWLVPDHIFISFLIKLHEHPNRRKGLHLVAVSFSPSRLLNNYTVPPRNAQGGQPLALLKSDVKTYRSLGLWTHRRPIFPFLPLRETSGPFCSFFLSCAVQSWVDLKA